MTNRLLFPPSRFEEVPSYPFARNFAAAQDVGGSRLTPIRPNEAGSAKYSDAVINALKSYSSQDRSGRNKQFRATSSATSTLPGVAYFFPGGCTYSHTTFDLNPALPSTYDCGRYSPTYSASSTNDDADWIQCRNWGGDGGGLNAWWGCNGYSDYTNVTLHDNHVGFMP